ncbi:putative transcription factor interactor and regulator CCHC(Zn) family [Helianthus annuus]|nr:putative transcription factor interactor and regulator CCHC(Zn) family [Helianthus annuus]
MNNKVQAQFEQHSDNRWIVIIDRTLNRNSGSKIGIGYSGDSYSTVNWFAWNCDKRNNIRDDCKGHVPTFKTRDHEHVMFECHDLNSAFCDDKNVCESPIFVPELKRNSFGKFLTEEIPEFIPSRTGMTDSEREVTEESSKEDSSFSASEKEEETSTSNEEQKSETSSEDKTTKGESSEDSSDETNDDQNSESSSEDPSCSDSSYEASEEQNSSEYQTSESSSESDNDEECSEDESRVDKKVKKAESSKHSSYTSSSNTKRPRRKRCFHCGHLGHTAKHCKTKNFPKPEYDFVKKFTYQLDYLKKSVKNLVNSTAYFWKQKEDIVAQNHDRFKMKQVWVLKSI